MGNLTQLIPGGINLIKPKDLPSGRALNIIIMLLLS